MFKRQRAAKWFLSLACLVILVCMTQRIASLHALEKSLLLTSSSQVVADANDGPTSCELSAKSLLASPPRFVRISHFLSGLIAPVVDSHHTSQYAVPSAQSHITQWFEGAFAIMHFPGIAQQLFMLL